jgi:hypothetical protein
MLCAFFLETSEQKRVCCLELLEQIAGSDDCKEKAAMLMALERTLARVLQEPDRSAVKRALDRTVEAFWTKLEAHAYDAGGQEWDGGLHEIAWDWLILQRPESERWNTWMALLAASSRAGARLLVRMVKGLAMLRDCAEQKERILLFASAAARMEAYPRKRILFEMARVLRKMEDDEAARDLWAAVNQVLAGG